MRDRYYGTTIDRLREGTEAYARFGEKVSPLPPPDLPPEEEPSIWEKIFQPFSPKVQAWQQRQMPIASVSDVVTSTTSLPSEAFGIQSPTDLTNVPEGQRYSLKFDEQGNPIGLPPPTPESFLQALARKEQTAFGALGQDIAQKVGQVPGVAPAVEWYTTPHAVPEFISKYGEITLSELAESPEGRAAIDALIAASGPTGIFKNLEAGMKQVKAGVRVTAKELHEGEAGFARIGKEIPKAGEAIPKAEVKPTTPIPEAKPTTTPSAAIPGQGVEAAGVKEVPPAAGEGGTPAYNASRLARKANPQELRQEGTLANYDLQSQQEWLGKGTKYSTPVPKNGEITIYRASLTGEPITPGDYVTSSELYARAHIENNLGGKGNISSVKGTLDDLIPADGPNEFWYAPKEVPPAAGVKEGAGGAIPPAKPPAPPIVPSKPSATPLGQPIMGDLQNADELVTTMTQPDVYRKIANLPGVRQVMSYLNPAGVAKTVPEKGVVARAALREEGGNKAIGAFSRLEAVGRREKVWGDITPEGILPTKSKLGGLSLDEVLTYRKKFAESMTPQQRQWAQEFHNLEEAKLQLLRRNGIEVNELSFEEGGEYVGRRVAGRINPLTNEMDEAAFIGSPGPGRPGAKMGAEKTRYFKDINEAIEEGYRYLSPDEALFLNIKGAYNRIADKQMSDWILERIPWRTSKAPAELALAKELAQESVQKVVKTLSVVNRAIRGEKIPTVTLNSIEPTIGTINLRTIMSDKAALQALRPELKKLITQRSSELRDIRQKFTAAREIAVKTHYGEATIQAPAFAGKILTGSEARETARVLNKAFSTQYGDIDSIISSVNKVNAIGRYFMLAGDASPLLIQLITFPFRFPRIWGKSAIGFTKALFSPEAQAAYLAKNNGIIQASRNLILSKGGQTEFTEAFRAGGIMQSKWAKMPKAVLEPFQRGFEGALDTAGIELRKAFDHLATTPQRTAEVEQFINEIRGVTSSARIGVSPHMRAAETAAVLAPRYNRAIAALVSDIARSGIRGDQARKALAALIAGGTAITAAISLARGEGWEGVRDHLDIRDSQKFVTWDVAGQNVGPGSKMRSLLVLLGKITKEPERTVDHANNFVRGNFSPVVGTGFDVLTGKDYVWQPTRPGKGVTFSEGMLGLTKRVVAENLVPIWVQSMALEGGDIAQRAIRSVTEFFGGRAYPKPAPKKSKSGVNPRLPVP